MKVRALTPLASCVRVNCAWRVALVSTMMFAVARAAEPRRPDVFQKYCVECHGGAKPKGGVSFERILAQASVGAHVDTWDKAAELLATGEMPPTDAEKFPSDAERAAAVSWIRTALDSYEREHAGEPGRVTVRRLTSGEYAYAIHDLTGLDLDTGIDASSDTVGGEGFTNFGDVQFVQDANLEHYLTAAKLVADHAVVGAGPLEFYQDTGRTGLELFALNRINDLHAAHGFRLVSGEGGAAFGLERYGKAFFTAWYFKNRAALGEPHVTLRELAAREKFEPSFAEHIWSVMNRANPGYPTVETVNRWKQLPAPTADIAASIKAARVGCDEVQKKLLQWPVWFFARGAPAKDGKGDESPLVFSDVSLKAVAAHTYTLPLAGGRGGFGGGGFFGGGGGGGRSGPGAAARGGSPKAPVHPPPVRVTINLEDINPQPGVSPVVIWRHARVVTREFVRFQRGGPGAAAGVAEPITNADGDDGNRRAIPQGPVIATQPLRELLTPTSTQALAFGTSPDGSTMGPDDFAIGGSVTFEITPPPPSNAGQLSIELDAEVGKNRDVVARVDVTNGNSNPNFGGARGPRSWAIIADPASAGYKHFRAGIDEYLASLPPNSHGEANPADKDPVPLPFDSTYNTPEHDAFVGTVKFQRTDQFFAAKMLTDAERAKLNNAWNDLFDAFPYHDNYLALLADHYNYKLPTAHVTALTAAQIAAMPVAMRPEVEKLRRDKLAVDKAQIDAEPGQLDDVLAFASRAWRRPLTRAEQNNLRAFYRRSRQETGLDHDNAIKATLARVLVSPAFIYRAEPIANARERALDDWELASRLSFFLWSSIPDEELRRAAAAGELTKNETLAKQVRRMTADPKARRLGTEFFGEWLGFYHFDHYRGVDTGHFPDFTAEVQAAMYDEAVSTFEYLVRENRPLRDLLHADYTFVNAPLAKFYGIPRDAIAKDAVTKLDGANAFGRGGALRLGAVLTVTSAPLRTSPVKRGDWVLRRILGTPTPPPPGDAGTLPGDPKTFGDLTIREKLEEHKRNETCAACHRKIDPLGFPLEGFDAVGRPRVAYDDGKPVDVRGELVDHRTLAGADGLLKYLDEREPQVMQTLAKKMLGYALGRTLLGSDRPLVNEMAVAGGRATFADLAVKIATSRQFRHRAGDEAPAANGGVVTDLPTVESAKAAN